MSELSVYVRVQLESADVAKTRARQLETSWQLSPFKPPDDVTRKKDVLYLFWDVDVDGKGLEDHEGLFRALAKTIDAPMHGSMYYDGSVEPCVYRIDQAGTRELYCFEEDGGERLSDYTGEDPYDLNGDEILDIVARAERDGVFGDAEGREAFIGEGLIQEALSELLAEASQEGETADELVGRAFDATELTTELVQQIFDDLQVSAGRRDLSGAMKHISPGLRGAVTNLVDGEPVKVDIDYEIYRSSLRLMFHEVTELELDNLELEIDVQGPNRAVIVSRERSSYSDILDGGRRVRSVSKTRHVCEIVNGKALITELESTEEEMDLLD